MIGLAALDFVLRLVRGLADAHVAAIDWLAAGEPSDSFNLGNGRGFSVSGVVKTSEKVTGLPV